MFPPQEPSPETQGLQSMSVRFHSRDRGLLRVSTFQKYRNFGGFFVVVGFFLIPLQPVNMAMQKKTEGRRTQDKVAVQFFAQQRGVKKQHQ